VRAVLQLKFREDASDEERGNVIRRLVADGARAVRPLFPGCTDRTRAAIYIVEGDEDEDRLLEYLDAAESVEFAERGAQRRATL
jgi:hypothetical protein